MRLFRIKNQLLLLFVVPFLVFGCNSYISSEGSEVSLLSTVEEPLISLPYWKMEPIEGKENSVKIELTRDVDFLVWTKENGEFIELPIPKGKKFPDTLMFKKGSHTFTFRKGGTYILNIHQKKDEVSNFNMDDKDFKGKVVIGKQAIKIKDDGYAAKVPKQALFAVNNDSKCYGEGNVINELVYVIFDKMQYDRKRKDNFGIYKTQFKYNNLNLQVGKQITLLFPMTPNGDTRRGGLILRPSVKDKKIHYYGQTTNRVNRMSVQGSWGGSHNGEFFLLDNGTFESVW